MSKGAWEPTEESVANQIQTGHMDGLHSLPSPSPLSGLKWSTAVTLQWPHCFCSFLWQLPLPYTVARMILKCKSQTSFFLVYGPLKISHWPWSPIQTLPRPTSCGGPVPCPLLYAQLAPLVYIGFSLGPLALSSMLPCQHLCTYINSSLFLRPSSSHVIVGCTCILVLPLENPSCRPTWQ